MTKLSLINMFAGIEAKLEEQVAFTKQALERQYEQFNLFIQTQALTEKEVFNSKETAGILDISEDHLYRLTSKRKIRFYKPEGKKLYFRKEDVISFMLRNPHRTTEEIGQEASARVRKGGKSW